MTPTPSPVGAAAARRRGSRRLLAAVVAVVVVTMTAPASGAVPVTESLTVSGSGPTAADVTLRAAIEFSYDDAVVEGGGRFAGLVVKSASGYPQGDVFKVPELSHVPYAGAEVMASRGRVVLKPGRYRFYLVAESDATITIPLRSGPSVTVAVPDRERFTAGLAVRSTGRDVLSTESRPTLSFQPPRKRSLRYLVVAALDGPAAFDATVSACLTYPGSVCGRRGATVRVSAGAASPLHPTSAVLGSPFPFRPGDGLEARAEATISQPRGSLLTMGVLWYETPLPPQRSR